MPTAVGQSESLCLSWNGRGRRQKAPGEGSRASVSYVAFLATYIKLLLAGAISPGATSWPA